MGGPGSGGKYPDPLKPYGGFQPPTPSRFHTRVGYAFGVTMWLWIFYRAKQDLPHLLVSFFFLLLIICIYKLKQFLTFLFI